MLMRACWLPSFTQSRYSVMPATAVQVKLGVLVLIGPAGDTRVGTRKTVIVAVSEYTSPAAFSTRTQNSVVSYRFDVVKVLSVPLPSGLVNLPDGPLYH